MIGLGLGLRGAGRPAAGGGGFNPLVDLSFAGLWSLVDDPGSTIKRNLVAPSVDDNLWHAPEQILTKHMDQGSGVTLTDNYDDGTSFSNDPYGTKTYSRLQFSGGSLQLLQWKNLSLPSTTYTVSFYAKSAVSGVPGTIRLIGVGGLGFSVGYTTTDAEQRFDWTFTAGYTLTTFYFCTDASNNAADVLIRGLKINVGPTATPYQRPAMHIVMPGNAALTDTASGLSASTASKWGVALRQTPHTQNTVTVYHAYRQTTKASNDYDWLLSDGDDNAKLRLLCDGGARNFTFSGRTILSGVVPTGDLDQDHVLAASYDGTDVRVYLDKVLVAVYRDESLLFTNRWLSMFALGGLSTGLGMIGDHKFIGYSDDVHTAAQIAQMTDWIIAEVEARGGANFKSWTKLVAYDGDSITDPQTPAYPGLTPYPTGIHNIGLGAGVMEVNFARSGSSVVGSNFNTSLTARASAIDDALVPQFESALYVIEIGTNDLTDDTAAWLANIKALGAAKKAAGWLVMVVPISPKNSAQFNINRATVHAEYANPANIGVYWDYYLDRTGLASYADSAPTDHTQYPDETHPAQGVHDAWATHDQPDVLAAI